MKNNEKITAKINKKVTERVNELIKNGWTFDTEKIKTNHHIYSHHNIYDDEILVHFYRPNSQTKIIIYRKKTYERFFFDKIDFREAAFDGEGRCLLNESIYSIYENSRTGALFEMSEDEYDKIAGKREARLKLKIQSLPGLLWISRSEAVREKIKTYLKNHHMYSTFSEVWKIQTTDNIVKYEIYATDRKKRIILH